MLRIEAETSGGEHGTTQERQSVAAAMDSLLQVAETLSISGYDIVSAADMEDLIRERVTEPSVEGVIEEEEQGKEEEKEDEPTVCQLTEIFALTEKLEEAIRNFD